VNKDTRREEITNESNSENYTIIWFKWQLKLVYMKPLVLISSLSEENTFKVQENKGTRQNLLC
jgi:hypothetical protein